LSVGAATALGLGVLVAGWLAYDLIWLSPLGRREALATAVCLALLLAAAYGLTRVLSGRAAYLHVGALLGTIMTANVWQRILPGQRRMIAAVRAGEKPDLALAARAKQRSKHNTFMALPVVFLMVSPHFPTTSYGHRWNWLLLLGFVLVGFAARWALNRWEGRREEEARPAGSPAFAPAAALAPVQAGAAPVAERSAGATAEALQRLNHSPIGQAVEELLACCGCRQWAEAVAGARPYEDAEDLLRAADGAFDRMDRDGWLEAFAAHPAIGESRAQGEQGAAARAWSAAEQAGTRAADRDTLAELAAANREYEARFGHVFLICAAGKSAAEMLAALSERLAHDPEREFDLAADEQRKITRLRFSKLLERLAGGATAAGAGEGRMRAERAAGGQGEG
jgi:OHCU decarboxylase